MHEKNFFVLLFTKQPGTVSGMDYGLERLVDSNQEEVKKSKFTVVKLS